ncbi:hypothetical protein SELMODRAFT_431616 [Selaginella moellendorffii]|uniref:Uncharacterized protein n=1 Tax=Selaginella moellendorffii TaxID=88036 RepID=D8TD80_SELML|nr:hypothetical protein SELMODRAFT_431616 [Selaginella moellendorffii]
MTQADQAKELFDRMDHQCRNSWDTLLQEFVADGIAPRISRKVGGGEMPLRMNAGKRYCLLDALTTANAHAGHHAAVQLLFASMLLDGIKPDELTFVCLLSSVAYTGIVDEVRERSMAMVADNFVDVLLSHRSAGEGGEAA